MLPKRLSSDRRKPLAVDLFCGLGGWTDGLLAAGYDVVGFDIERHQYGDSKYPAQMVLQDVLTIHGSMFRDAAVIVCSPPCQNYSYLAMPWSRSTDPENSKAAKALRKKWETEGPDNRLFDACFRIQREAIEATGKDCTLCNGTGLFHYHAISSTDCGRCGGTGKLTRYIPMIVENVRGAQPWVGRSKAQFGSFHLWGDVAQIGNRVVAGRDLTDIKAGRGRFGMGVAPEKAVKVPSFRFDGSGRSFQTASVNATGGKGTKPVPNRGWTAGTAITLGLENYGGVKVPGQIQGKEYAMCRTGAEGQTTLGVKTPGRSLNRGGKKFGTHNMGSAKEIERELGVKIGGDWFSDPNSTCRKHGSKSNARKAASALIAKIPYALSRYIAEQHWPLTV